MSTILDNLTINMEPNRIHYRKRLTQNAAQAQWCSDITDAKTVLNALNSGFANWWTLPDSNNNYTWTINPPGSSTEIKFSPISGTRSSESVAAYPNNIYDSTSSALSSWIIGVTQYGVVMSQTISQAASASNQYILNNRNILYYFTVLRNIFNQNDQIPALFYSMNTSSIGVQNGTGCNITRTDLADNDNSYEWFVEYGGTEPETINSEYYKVQRFPALYPVLTNMCCKNQPYFAPYLYIKETNSNDCYGKILLDDTVFLAGSFYALAAGSLSSVEAIKTTWINHQSGN